MSRSVARPSPSVEGNMMTQIDDLVQRNRTLEHLNKKLGDENALLLEKHKRALHDHTESHKRSIHDMKVHFNEERVAFREGCNRILSSHQLAHLRLTAKLVETEDVILTETNATRQQKLACLHRDFQLTMFRVRESQLEARIEDLEDQLKYSSREGNDHILELQGKLRAQEEEIEALGEQQSNLEQDLDKLRESHTRLESAKDSATTKLERLNLQLEGAKTAHKDLERQNDELKRTNDQLKHQLDRWQNLENKGGEETEFLRKKSVDLGVQVKALEQRLEKRDAELKKEKEKLSRFKANAKELEVYAGEQREEAEVSANALAAARLEIEQLKQALEEAQSSYPHRVSPTVSETEIALDMADVVPSSPARPISRKPVLRTAVAGPSNISDDDIEEVPPPPKKRATSKQPTAKRPKLKPRSQTISKEDSEDSEEERKPTRAKGKAKAVDEDSAKPAARTKRRREESEPAQTKPRSRVNQQIQPRGSKLISDDEDEAPAAKKKKRTIGIFPTNSQPSFNFLSTTATTIGGIDIPTVLSPVRPDDPVPSRSAPTRTTSSSGLISNFFSWKK
ncbi:hypothetical protein MIND_00239800 [Mycena indigotica]|uniref:Uncharacterized protein n=1 Tax=Mycena indigotica TaxID=2126181 RepID=A0A8H6T5P8_9AGAR|nr:uncharacterized protein MIND_00239800 [Mycena indigotica]KAF7312268.1 hypothetical protein MIND_00239800 [Mycena indigotica]